MCIQNFNGGSQPTSDEVWAFYKGAMQWIMETDWIKGAFPFGRFILVAISRTLINHRHLGFMHDMSGVNPNDLLMSASGTPTPLGAFILGGNYN